MCPLKSRAIHLHQSIVVYSFLGFPRSWKSFFSFWQAWAWMESYIVYPEIWWHHTLLFPPRSFFEAKTVYYRYQSHPNRVSPKKIIAPKLRVNITYCFFVGWIGVYFATTGPSLKAVNLRFIFEAKLIHYYDILLMVQKSHSQPPFGCFWNP